MSKFLSAVAGLGRFALALFGFLQWLAGIAIGVFSFYGMLQDLEEFDPPSIEEPAAGGADLFDGALELLGSALEAFSSLVTPIALMDSARTWLLFSIMLMVSGIYCHLAARPSRDRS